MAVLSDDMGGITAYAAAVNRGYTGTKEEFEQLMYSYTEVAERAEAAAGNAHESEEASIEAKDIAVSAKNEAVSARDAAQSARDASISAKNDSQSARDAAISAKNDTLAAKDAVMDAKSDVDETSANFSDAVTAAISDVNAAGRNQKELAKTHAIDSEAWAVGQREGADVGVSDETYHNNSKYYAEQSALAKSETETARDTAITAKDNAIAAKNEAETAKGEAQDIVDGINAKSEQIDQNTSDISELNEDLTTKANIDGSYEDLVSGGAYQIISNMEEVDNTPYNYRTAGGSLEIGDREKLKKIVGGSLAVNQLVEMPSSSVSQTINDVTVTDNRDGTYSVITTSGGATANTVVEVSKSNINAQVDHVYATLGCPTGGSSSTYFLQWSGIVSYDTGSGAIYKRTGSLNSWKARINVNSGTIISASITFKPNVFDLTQMFGATIADYIYSLEQANAGAGVAWLKSHFPRIFDAGYIPYNAGTLEHVSGLSAHKMVGFNQWDEEWEVGTINSGNGQNVAASDRIRSKNYTHIINSMQYYVCLPDSVFNGSQLYVALYDADKNFVRASLFNTANGFSERILAPYFLRGASYLRFWFGGDYGITYKGDVCLNLHWDGERDGEYEPYEEHSYPLDSDVTLRGIPKLDANNSLYYDGDEYSADGTVTRRYGIVDLGTLTWEYHESNNRSIFATAITDRAYTLDNNKPINVVCARYEPASFNATWVNGNIASNGSGTTWISIVDNNYSSAATFKTAMSGVYLVYELATPTTETADPYTEIQNVSNWGTEEFVTTSLVPVGHETAYQPDLRAKIEVAPESPDTDGYYLMKRENGENAYVAYLGELPSDPTTDGTYTLKCTVASGTATKTWEADE